MICIEEYSDHLELDNNGIWTSKKDQKFSYPKEASEKCFEVEEASFWFQHRNNIIHAVLETYCPSTNKILFDIGGGNGFVSKRMIEEGFSAVLIEPNKTAAFNAKKRGLKNVICASFDKDLFKPDSLPSVGLFDVLEHIENDLEFLKFLNIQTKHHGIICLTVPAYNILWSEDDIYAGHFRRYTLETLSQALKLAGFSVLYSSYFFQFLVLPILFARSLPSKLGISLPVEEKELSSDHIVKSRIIDNILNLLIKREMKIIQQGKTLKFGSSCIIVAKKE